jgi:hypothetical protein
MSANTDLIVELLTRGNFTETAAAFAGVTSRTIRGWLRQAL